MDANTTALFDEARKPTHCGKRAIHDRLQPFGDLVLSLQAQIGVYRRHLTTAELAPHDHALDGKFEMLHQTLNALESEAAAVFAGLRRLANTATQWERYMTQAEADVEKYEAARQAEKDAEKTKV